MPIDYIKSCPYVLSFMRNYKLKKWIEDYFKSHPEEISKAKSNLLWLNTYKINNYEEIPDTNARLKRLKDEVFDGKSELYLWVPPSRPYYTMEGAYKNANDPEHPFSKMLVFSAWEMVPRMIGSLISYEAERRTVGRLSKQTKNVDKKNANYFAEGNKRFPVSRLRFNVSLGEVRGMNLFCLLYPSKALADMYHPYECINAGLDLGQIRKDIERKIKESINLLKPYQKIVNNREDERWYYLAPMLLDGVSYVKAWLKELDFLMRNDEEERKNKGFHAHIKKVMEYLDMGYDIGLGRFPDDLYEKLTDMVLGSFAVCIYRTNNHDMAKATDLAKIFLNRFNTTEATAIIDLTYGRRKDDNAHWQNVLRYCRDGCFQAMFDEYYHLISESANLSSSEDKGKKIYDIMRDSLTIHSATYTVDTYKNFANRMEGNKERNQGLRSHFAVGFTKGEGNDSKNVNRKESVRNAFNSPLRPFVLATTSIGQEGLDFHNYCRRIMHWNLPSNPIDLEQREGRINRYKCLAIRQNIALKYGDIHIKDDLWNEMFEAAAKGEVTDNQSNLVPYWCFGKNQTIKIERIVPMYPMRKDENNYQRLIKILSLYRLTLGQARQEELLEYIFHQFDDTDQLKKLFIDLSPYTKGVDA